MHVHLRIYFCWNTFFFFFFTAGLQMFIHACYHSFFWTVVVAALTSMSLKICLEEPECSNLGWRFTMILRIVSLLLMAGL